MQAETRATATRQMDGRFWTRSPPPSLADLLTRWCKNLTGTQPPPRMITCVWTLLLNARVKTPGGSESGVVEEERVADLTQVEKWNELAHDAAVRLRPLAGRIRRRGGQFARRVGRVQCGPGGSGAVGLVHHPLVMSGVAHPR